MSFLRDPSLLAKGSIDKKSLQKAIDLYDSSESYQFEVGTFQGLSEIHRALFHGLYAFAGKIRTRNIAKDGFVFANVDGLEKQIKTIEQLPEYNLEEIVHKYIQMNMAHPFQDGNGRAMRIWLDMMLRENLNKIVDWQHIRRAKYFDAIKKSHSYSDDLITLIDNHLTDKIDDREVIVKGLEQSYFFEGYQKPSRS
jgi:cell filamentation protein